MAASIIIMFLDELIQKGWGLGSGISLFIMAGVAQQILWSMFSPLPAGDGGMIGIIPYIVQSLTGSGDITNILFPFKSITEYLWIVSYRRNITNSCIYTRYKN